MICEFFLNKLNKKFELISTNGEEIFLNKITLYITFVKLLLFYYYY